MATSQLNKFKPLWMPIALIVVFGCYIYYKSWQIESSIMHRLKQSDASCGSVRKEQQIEVTNCQKYTHYVLAIQRWCADRDNWGLHGLWPEYVYGSIWPQFCQHVEYEDISKDAALMNRLNKYWKCSKHGVHKFGWHWEWIKHGTCMRYYTKDMSYKQYLNTSMMLFEEAIKDGTLEQKCGNLKDPKRFDGEENEECWAICYDLDFNYVDCSEYK